MFYYFGNPRLQLWFSSPNICGAFLCMAFFAALGVHLFLAGEKRTSFRERFRDLYLAFRECKLPGVKSFLSVVFFLLALFLEYLLAITYSRGAYLAFFAGLGLFLFECRRKRLLFLGLTFFFILASVSSGMRRLASVCEIREGSIYNRLVLWRGMAEIMAENPVYGAGTEPYGRIGELYSAWHQPLNMHERYTTAVCDFLTIGAERGVFAIFAYLALSMSLIWLGARLHRATGNTIALGLASAMFSYLVASIFSTFCKDSDIYIIFWGTFALLAGLLIYGFLRKRIKFSFRSLLFPCGVAAALSFALFIAGLFFTALSDIKYRYAELQNGNSSVPWVSVSPRNREALGRVLYFFDSDKSDIEKEARSIIRPLACKGFKVNAIGVDSGFNGLELAKNFIRQAIIENSAELALMGCGSGGRIAILAGMETTGARISSAVAIDSEMDWPFPELSPIENAEKISFPLLLLFSEKKQGAYDTAMIFAKKVSKSETATRVVVGTVESIDETIRSATDFILSHSAIGAVRFIGYEDASRYELENSVAWLFGTSACRRCENLKEALAVALNPGSIVIELDIKKPENAVIFLRLAEHCGIASPALPSILINGVLLAWNENINVVDLKNEFSIQRPEKPPEFLLDKNPGDDFLKSKKNSLTVSLVISAGLIDGINPCVFSTLVFLFSLLAIMRGKHSSIFFAGTVYCFASFLTYFLIGIGILNIVKGISRFETAKAVLDLVIFFALLVCAFLSFMDAWRFSRTGNTDSVILKLPDGLKKKISNLLKTAFSHRIALPAVFLAGVLVTLFESACTGQVYMPVLAILAKNEGWMNWIPHLLLYNLSFIAPLVIFFALSFLGISVYSMLALGKRELVFGKIALGILFLLLSIIQILYLISEFEKSPAIF